SCWRGRDTDCWSSRPLRWPRPCLTFCPGSASPDSSKEPRVGGPAPLAALQDGGGCDTLSGKGKLGMSRKEVPATRQDLWGRPPCLPDRAFEPHDDCSRTLPDPGPLRLPPRGGTAGPVAADQRAAPPTL